MAACSVARGVAILLAIIIAVSANSVSSLECEYYNLTDCGHQASSCNKSKRTVTCGEDTSKMKHSCWTARRKTNDRVDILIQGCFINNHKCYTETKCVDKSYGKWSNGDNHGTGTVLLFCCCQPDNCNREFEWRPAPTTTTIRPEAVIQPHRSETSTLLIVLVVVVPIIFVIVIATVFIILRQIKKTPSHPESGPMDLENISQDEPKGLSEVTLLEMMAEGRFGSVWKAAMEGKEDHVAVKIFLYCEKVSWKLEQEIYSLPLMSNREWVLEFFEARKHFDGEVTQFWLITEYLELGSLYNYLKGNILEWHELQKVAITMCQGLDFLHETAAVAHRDFKSRNVLLLRPDLTACIADFGLAQIFYPDKPIGIGSDHGQVGTRRYMAPEVLQGAVSLTRDGFRHIDMYACGLVLWELASRCSADQGLIGEYRLPYEEYIGLQPSLDDMRYVVLTQRKRPTIRNSWLSHSVLAILVEAMKDAWDQDEKARISASCIVGRLDNIRIIM